MIKGGRISNIVNKLEENKPITNAEKKSLRYSPQRIIFQSLATKERYLM
jgi:hypothetical protein